VNDGDASAARPEAGGRGDGGPPGAALADAVEAGRAAQPLWSLVPPAARARYVRRAAMAMLDELDDLAPRLAETTGWPRAQLVVSELLPAVRGLRALADDGPGALAEQRLSPRRAALAGRSVRLVPAPAGVIGLRGPAASPWAEPALEAAAAVLAGNAALLAGGPPLVAQRLRAIFLRAGLPGELLALVAPDGLDAVCDRVIDLPRDTRRGLVLVLPGAPRRRVVEAALWAAFARHSGAAGRLVVAGTAADGLVADLAAGAARLRVGDPRDPATEIGPLDSADALAAVEAALVGADAQGGGRVPDLDGPHWRPTVVAGVGSGDPLFTSPPPGPVLAVHEAESVERAIAVAAGAASVSVWARDRDQGERVARRLAAPLTWVGRHGEAPPGVPLRLARHTVPRQVESRTSWAPGAPRLAAGPRIVESLTALAELRHGRESRRWAALRTLLRAARD
jgi:acyl-CoA reductase-like NAD-dependent aldehyde dehydrogenase